MDEEAEAGDEEAEPRGSASSLSLSHISSHNDLKPGRKGRKTLNLSFSGRGRTFLPSLERKRK